MVIPLQSGFVLLAREAASGEKLPEPIRTMALMALLGIALLGMLIVVMTLLGGRWVRRWSEFRSGRGVPPDLILKRQPPLSPQPTGNKVNSGDTVGSDETVS